MDVLLWLVAAWFGLSVWVAIRAGMMHRSGGAFLVVSLLFSPILGGLLLGILGRGRPDEREAAQERARVEAETLRKCPVCAEMIRREALKCRFCGADVQTGAVRGPGS